MKTATFLTKLRTEKIAEAEGVFGRAKHMLTRHLQFYSAILDKVITAPAGFTTDFGSVPRLPLAYSLFGDVGHASAAIHDYLLVTGVIPRWEADKIYVEALKVEKVGAWRRYPMFLGVRIGTVIAWLQGRA